MKKSRPLRFCPDPFRLRNRARLAHERTARQHDQEILDWAIARDIQSVKENALNYKRCEAPKTFSFDDGPVNVIGAWTDGFDSIYAYIDDSCFLFRLRSSGAKLTHIPVEVIQTAIDTIMITHANHGPSQIESEFSRN